MNTFSQNIHCYQSADNEESWKSIGGGPQPQLRYVQVGMKLKLVAGGQVQIYGGDLSFRFKQNISLYFSVFLCISLYFLVFLCISLYFSVFLCIFLYFFVFLSRRAGKFRWRRSQFSIQAKYQRPPFSIVCVHS